MNLKNKIHTIRGKQVMLDRDLAELYGIKGMSRRNLNYMRKLYLFVSNNKKMQQVVAQIPWGHIILIITKIKDRDKAFFYINKTINNSWSRAMLELQISSDLY